jgi:hypothetical protein
MTDDGTDITYGLPDTLDDLRLSVSGWSDSLDSAFKYWGEPAFQSYSVNERKAEAILETLRKIRRGVDRIDAEYGSAASFGRYVQRVAKVLGITRVGFFPPRGESTWASGERIRFITTADAAGSIDRKLDEWKYEQRDAAA